MYERVRRAHESSAFADPSGAHHLIGYLILRAAREAGGYPILPLGEALYTLVAELLDADGLMYRYPPPPAYESLSIEEAVGLRRYLRRKEIFLSDAERHAELWCHKVVSILVGQLKSLPDAFLVESTQEAAERASDIMATSLIDLCHEPSVLVERTLITCFDDDICDAGILDTVRDRLDANILAASGVDPKRSADAHKKLIFPTQAIGAAPREIVSRYCEQTPFAEFYRTQLPFAVPFPARFEHTHIIGGSGHGKTQLLQSMLYDDLLKAQEDGRAVVVIDSQGDLIRTIARLHLFSPDASDSLADRLVIIDPTDIAFPVCLNLFDWGGARYENADPVEREKLLNSAIGLYEYIFGALLGAELTQKQGVIFKFLARLMLEIPDATIHTLAALMENGEPFRPYMDRLTGSAQRFFATRFFDRGFNETKKQILNRLWGVLSNSTLERIFGSPRNKIDLYEAINTGKIVLINTAKDLLTQDGAALFGRFFVALLAQAAIQRSAIQPYDRRSAFVYIDEAADYFDDTIEHLLNQARKYRVGLILAHQNLDQLSTGLRGSLMASTSVKFAGGVSGKDARALAEEMHCDPDFLQGMRKRKSETEFACFVRSFTPSAVAVTVPLGHVEKQLAVSTEEYQELIDGNRERYCVPLEDAVRITTPAMPAMVTPTLHTPRPTPTAAQPTPPQADAEEMPTPPPPPVQNEANQREAPPQTHKTRTPSAKQPKPPSLAPLGRGGKQHQYLQHFIKGIAEERGWRAVIEESILEGAGKIDVLLSRGDRRIACEISVTTSRDHELRNVEKCIAAGHVEIILVTAAERQRQMFQKYIGGALEETDREKVKYLLPDEMLEYLSSQESPTEQTVRGYRVIVRKRNVDAQDAEVRRKAIASVIARSLKRDSPT